MVRAPKILFTIFWSWLGALWLGACGGGFDPQYLVQDLQILAVRSSPPGAVLTVQGASGTRVVFDALAVDPGNVDAVLSYEWTTAFPDLDALLADVRFNARLELDLAFVVEMVQQK